MKPSKHKLVRRMFALALAAFLLVGWLGPIVVGEYGDRTRRSGYAEAANRHIVRIESGTTLFDRPLLVAERAVISLELPDDRALSSEEIAGKLQDGTAHLVIAEGKVLLDSTGLHPARVSTVADDVKAIVQALADRSFAKVTVRDVKIMTQSAESAAAELFGHLTCNIERSAPDQLDITGTLQRNGLTLPFEVSLNTKAARSASGRLPFNAKIASDLLTATLSGDMVRGEAFNLIAPQTTVTAPDVKDVLAWLSGTPVQGNGLGQFQATGPMEWTDRTFTFQDAKFQIDGNAATGGLSVSVAGDRPLLDGTLAFENLDLAPYVRSQPEALAELAQSALDWPRWLAGVPSPRSLVRNVNADLRLSANTVTVGKTSLGGGAASLTLKDGKLFADLAEIELDKTQGNARLSLDLSGVAARFEVRGTLDSTDLAGVTRLFLDRQIVSGAGRFDADFRGSGATEDELRASLSGTAALSMPDGGGIAFDIGSLLSAAKSGGLGWDQVATGTTPVDSLTAKMQATKGVLTATEIQAETQTKTLQLGGTIDLSQRTVDLSLAASPKPAASGSAQNERIRIRGPLLAPAIKSDASKAALNLPPPSD